MIPALRRWLLTCRLLRNQMAGNENRRCRALEPWVVCLIYTNCVYLRSVRFHGYWSLGRTAWTIGCQRTVPDCTKDGLFKVKLRCRKWSHINWDTTKFGVKFEIELDGPRSKDEMGVYYKQPCTYPPHSAIITYTELSGEGEATAQCIN